MDRGDSKRPKAFMSLLVKQSVRRPVGFVINHTTVRCGKRIPCGYPSSRKNSLCLCVRTDCNSESHRFVNSFYKIVHFTWLMLHAHSDSSFTHILHQNLSLIIKHTHIQYSKQEKLSCMYIYSPCTVQMQVYVNTHMQDLIAAHSRTHVCTLTQSITQSHTQDESPMYFLSEKFVNRFQGSVIYFLSVYHGFTLN